MARPSIRVGVVLAAGGPILAMTACSSISAEPAGERLEPARSFDITGSQIAGPTDSAVDRVDVTHRRLTLPPGSRTGPHCHHGQLTVVVEQGELTHYADTYLGGVTVYRDGDSVVEVARYVHETVNEGSVDLVLRVTHFTPEGKPMEEWDLSQCEG